MESTNYTLFGMTRQPISIIKNDSTKFEAILVYKDDHNLYLQDSSISINSNAIDAIFFNSMAVKIDDIISYKTVQTKLNTNSHHGFIDMYKELR